MSSTSILGISAFYHDSAAALVIDGEIVAAAQEERFTRDKQDQSFPQNAPTGWRHAMTANLWASSEARAILFESQLLTSSSLTLYGQRAVRACGKRDGAKERQREKHASITGRSATFI